MTSILSLADDATGAFEVGAQFARAGIPARISLGAAPLHDARTALVIDTETRHFSPDAAYQRIRTIAAPAWDHVFKKTDSTLRGNIAAEFKALLEAFPNRPLVYAPAYPQLGRTVVGGNLFVHGRALAETAFTSDPLNPVCQGSIPVLLQDCGAPLRIIAGPAELQFWLERRDPSAVCICDGSTDDDLAKIAAALQAYGKPCLAAGTAGFAGFWIRQFAGAARTSRPPVHRCLLVNGSLHPVSRQQMEAARAIGWPVLATPCERSDDPLSVAASLALTVRERLETSDFDGLIVFGGDTLYAILRVLGIDMVEACDELLPGVPLTRARWKDRDLAFITKAGGFGEPDVLARIRRCLEEQS